MYLTTCLSFDTRGVSSKYGKDTAVVAFGVGRVAGVFVEPCEKGKWKNSYCHHDNQAVIFTRRFRLTLPSGGSGEGTC